MSNIGACIAALIFGIVAGLTVQRSKFCTTSALRDAILFRNFRNAKALVAAMIVLSIGFTLFMSVGEGKAAQFDAGLNQFAGMFIFGIGMILAGGCTVSTLVKSGEGNVTSMIALAFIFISMFLFSLLWTSIPWPPAPVEMTGKPNLQTLQIGFANASTLQSYLKIPAVVFGVIQAVILLGIYRAMARKDNRSSWRRERGMKQSNKSGPAD